MAQSLEAALDEERREIMALLEGRAKAAKSKAASVRASSPAAPQSPVRSMLDFDVPTPRGQSPMLRHASIAGQGVGVSQPAPQTIRSMLDFGAAPTSQPMQPLTGSKSAPLHAVSPPPRINLEKEYNFDILPGAPEQGSLPKRVSQGGKPLSTSLKNTGIFGSVDNKTRSEGSSAMFGKSRKSHSPGIFGNRAKSPATGLNSNSSSLMTGPNTYVTDSGRIIDMTSAYRRLSDAALIKSGSSLARLPSHRGSDTGEQVLPDGSSRLTMDALDDDDAVDSNDESSNDSDEEDWASEVRRGRNRTRKDSNEMVEEDDGPGRRQAKSLLGAAEEERKTLVANTTVRSLLDDFYPDGDKIDKATSKRSGIHPRTAFDAESGDQTPVDSDEEEQIEDFRQAQHLTMQVSGIRSDPANHRCIRQIVRGNYDEVADEARLGLRRQRMYLVATDLSEEAAYAMEWTVGTVLKDGDTLLAVYAADIAELSPEAQSTEKNAKLDASVTSATPSNLPSPTEQPGDAIEIGHGIDAFKDTAEIVRTLSNTSDTIIIRSGGSSHLRAPSASDIHGRSASPATAATSRSVSKSREMMLQSQDYSQFPLAEAERFRGIEALTTRCIALLRKTKLQVRIVIDVVHCKSPRHMIVEVIDYLSPTLVILGSRGRSAIKNVLLGSFSNYLVAKSSVPVMVARKKLKKQSKSFKRSNIRLSNVLSTGSSARLATAKIDKLISRSR